MTIAKDNFNGRITSVVDRAAAVYERKGLKFTILRRLVLEAVAERHTPVGAYTIIHVLEPRYRKLSPISVYRALDSLMSLGVVRKLKTQKAYFIADSFLRRTKQPSEKRLYLLCEECNRVTEAAGPGAYHLIEQISSSALFKLSVNTVEVSGICEECRASEAKPRLAAGLRQRPAGNEARAARLAAR